MTYLTHDQVSDRIIEILKTFNTFPLNVYNPSLVWSIVPPDKARAFNRIVDDDKNFRLILRKLNNEAILEMYDKCRMLVEKYDMHVTFPLKETVIVSEPLGASPQDKILEKLITQIRKFGNEELNKRLEKAENGQSRIVFAEMAESTEGHTVFENGKVTYKLNKKYEKITDDENLWRASIILAHELQRNPASGDLRNETTEIAQKDVKFIEELARQYGKRVYELNPDFLVMHYVREMFGDEGGKSVCRHCVCP